MGSSDFVDGLRALGHAVEELPNNLIIMPYTVPVGPRMGEHIRLGFTVPTDWPLTPPSGPCVSPRIVPIHPDQSVGHPVGGVHEADHFGPDWQYWSRPIPHWHTTDRSVRAYMAHISRLFGTL